MTASPPRPVSPVAGFEKISPARAAELLKGNQINRKLRRTVVERYSRDMLAGNWHEAGDPIRLDDKGTLLDGQHRLSAIIQSGLDQKMLVVKGIQTRAILSMDTGAKRSFADVLRIQGHTNVTNLAALARWCVLYEDENRTVNKDTTTHAEMMEWLERNIDAPETVRRVCAQSNNVITKRIRMPLLAVTHYAKNKHDADIFASRLAAGTGLNEGDAIHTLRRYVENLSIATPPSPMVLHAVVIKAWNAYMEGRQVQVLAFRAGGSAPEPFPVIVTEA